MRTKVAMFNQAIASVILVTFFGLGFSFQQEVSLKQKTAEADLIVVGRITGVESKWSKPKANTYTYSYISIEEYIKGFSLDKDITIRRLGGAVGDIVSAVPGMASFEKGERVVVFLVRDIRSDNFIVVRGIYGKYKIREDNTVVTREVSLLEFLDEKSQSRMDAKIRMIIAPASFSTFREYLPDSSSPSPA